MINNRQHTPKVYTLKKPDPSYFIVALASGFFICFFYQNKVTALFLSKIHSGTFGHQVFTKNIFLADFMHLRYALGLAMLSNF
ncbi:hypothetical protein DLE54_10485 [Psychrobacter sp. YP14]|nr:hypothetical protein DLE54_10485 [Psychrobacter sp. YP14]